jgi:hypothetical protein
MDQVYFTVEQLARALAVNPETIRRYARREQDCPFPNIIRPGGRRMGYRIPASDALALAMKDFPWRVSVIQRYIRQLEQREEDLLAQVG